MFMNSERDDEHAALMVMWTVSVRDRVEKHAMDTRGSETDKTALELPRTACAAPKRAHFPSAHTRPRSSL